MDDRIYVGGAAIDENDADRPIEGFVYPPTTAQKTMNENEDLQREREKLELEKRRLELERERFAFEREKQAANTPQPASQTTTPRRSVPIAMWILGAAMLVACFLPWIEMRGSWDFGIAGRGSMFLGDASGTHFWQGQLCIVLLVGAVVAKLFRQRAVAGVCALVAPLFAVHFVLQVQGMLGHSQSVSFMGMTASNSLHADPSIGSIALVILSIPFAILAFRRSTARADGTVIAAPSAPAANVPWLLVGMIAVQLGLVATVMAMFSSASRKYVPYFLLFAVLNLVICVRRKWPKATFWSAVLIVTAALGWALKPPPYSDWFWSESIREHTGSAIGHIGVQFNVAFIAALPFVCSLFVGLVLLTSWQERSGRGVMVMGGIAGGPRWRQVLLASCLVLIYPVAISAFHATKLDTPTSSDRERAESFVRELTSGDWIVFDPQYPSETTTFKLAQMYEGTPSKLRFSDYGDVSTSLTLDWDGRAVLSGAIRFRASDEHLPDSLDFSSRNNRVVLSALRNNLMRVHVESSDPNDSQGEFTTDKLACRASTYMQRQTTVSTLEDRLQAHCIFLSPQQVQGVTGEAIPTRAGRAEVVAIAKDVLLLKDTIGVARYRYEALPSPAWTGLTDTTITLDHQIRFVAMSRDGSGELRTLRTYQSVFDTTGVLLASTETERVRESATTNNTDSTYMAEGIFVNATCNEECYVTFRVHTRSGTEERRLLYAVVTEKVPLMLNADGAGDFTNPALVGKSFMLILKQTAVTEEYADPSAMPRWVESVVFVDPI